MNLVKEIWPGLFPVRGKTISVLISSAISTLSDFVNASSFHNDINHNNKSALDKTYLDEVFPPHSLPFMKT